MGSAKPIKQLHFSGSPAVEKAMYTEIDRMLQLGIPTDDGRRSLSLYPKKAVVLQLLCK